MCAAALTRLLSSVLCLLQTVTDFGKMTSKLLSGKVGTLRRTQLIVSLTLAAQGCPQHYSGCLSQRLPWLQTCLITGGGRGIGQAVAKALAKEGGKIAVVARSRDQLEEVSRHYQTHVAL